MNSSACMNRYEHYQRTAQQSTSSLSFDKTNHFSEQNKSSDSFRFSNTSDWTGYPLIKIAYTLPNKRMNFNHSFNKFRNNDSVYSNRTHSKGNNNKDLNSISNNINQNDKADNFITNSCDSSEMHIALNHHGNGTCLPRIIKPRKRRKKDRKPTNNLQQTENVSSTFPFTFSSNTNKPMQNLTEMNVCANEKNIYNYSQVNGRNFKPGDYDNNVFSFNTILESQKSMSSNVASSSVSSSSISLSNSSLSSTANSYCSCQLCDPNCKIWCFPLRRSFSDNSSSKVDMKQTSYSNSENDHHWKYDKKDVGVIGSNRSSKIDTKTCNKSLSLSLTLMDFIQSEQKQNYSIDHEEFGKSNFNNSVNDSDCSSVLNNLDISDDIISSTIKTVNENLSINEVKAITKQLSNFDLLDYNISNNDSNLNTNEKDMIFLSNGLQDTQKFNYSTCPTTIFKINNHEDKKTMNEFPISNHKSEINENQIMRKKIDSFDTHHNENNKISELFFSNLVINNETNETSYFNNEIENFSLFI